jgi:flavin-binding protein dodecin
MSVINFIPSIWDARLLAKFHERSIASVITTAPERIEGNKIIFNNVSDVAVSDYKGTVSWADLTTSKVELPMDIKKYWAFKVDDVDKVQAAGELIDPHVEEASATMAETMDRAVLAEALNTTNEVEKATTETIYDVIVKCNMELNKRKVPKSNRFAVINAEALASLNLDARFTLHYQILENGIIEGADINGTVLVFSEELNEGNEAVLLLHKSAVGFGTQLEETEAMRLETAFADGVRGLAVAGTKTLRDNAIVKYTKA